MNPFHSSGEQWEASLERERQTHYEHAAAYGHEEIDESLAVPDPPRKRSDKETSRLLAILDGLERGNG